MFIEEHTKQIIITQLNVYLGILQLIILL